MSDFTMSARALGQGDRLPPPDPDVLRLYSMRMCGYAHRTRLVLQYKNIPYEVVNCDLRHKADWLFERNPFGAVPIIEYKNRVIFESVICNEFLDDLYPEKKLVPIDPYEKAKHKQLMHFFDAKIMSSGYLVLRPERKGSDKAREALKQGLDKLEKALDGKRLFGGDGVCMVDYHVYPWFERYIGFRSMSPDGYDPVPLQDYPRLAEWISRMQQRPEVKATMMDLDLHRQFTQSLFNKKPNYDLGLQEAVPKL